MNVIDIVKLSTVFFSFASGGLSSIKKELSAADSFDEKLKIAEDNFDKIAQGSSRCVYLTDADTVLKLARNDRGLAQNNTECSSNSRSKFVNPVVDNDKDYYWVEASHLKQLNEAEFKQLVGVSFHVFSKSFDYELNDVSDSDHDKPSSFDDVKDLDIFKELVEFCRKNKLMPGDVTRISSFCQKDGRPVLIDYGLDSNTFEELYAE